MKITPFRVAIYVFLLIISLFISVLITVDAHPLWKDSISPAPTTHYQNCPTSKIQNVTSHWVSWKYGNNDIFDRYQPPYKFLFYKGVWLAYLKSNSTSDILIYYGIWLDNVNTTPTLLTFHPSCGVFISRSLRSFLESLD